MARTKKYTKKSQRAKVKEELSKDAPMVVRIYRESCPACQMSEGPWMQYCKRAPSNMAIIEIEEEAMPLELLKNIDAFPTYAIHDENNESRHHTGALMSPEEIDGFITGNE